MANPFDGAFTKTVPTKNIKPDTDLGNIFLKSIKTSSEKVPTGAVIKKLPSYVGGGEFLSIPGKPEELVLEKRSPGTLEVKPGSERDHIIPVSLGGTSNDPNLEYLKSNKTIWQKLLNKPASAKNRQEGKMLVEWSAINDYKAGRISLPEARARVLNWNNQPDSYYKLAADEAKNLLTGGLKKTIIEPLAEFGKELGAAPKNLLNNISSVYTKYIDEPAKKVLNTPTAQNVISKINETTQDIPLRFIAHLEGSDTGKTVQSLANVLHGPLQLLGTAFKTIPQSQKTSSELITEWKNNLQNPNNPVWKQFLYQIQNTLPQTAIGTALSFIPIAGKPLALSYWSALSAQEQISDKGQVYSLGNIAIDTIGDTILSSSMERMFRVPAQSLLKILSKNFGIEGGTEVAQSLLKYANNWRNAKTPADRTAALEEAKKYIRSGAILMEFAVGGTAGAVLGIPQHILTKFINESPYKQLSAPNKQALLPPGPPPPPPPPTKTFIAPSITEREKIFQLPPAPQAARPVAPAPVAPAVTPPPIAPRTPAPLPPAPPSEYKPQAYGKIKATDIKRFFDENYKNLSPKDQDKINKIIYGMRGEFTGETILNPAEQKFLDRVMAPPKFPTFAEYYKMTGGYKGVIEGRDTRGDYVTGVIDALEGKSTERSRFGTAVPTQENIDEARKIIENHSLQREKDLARLDKALGKPTKEVAKTERALIIQDLVTELIDVGIERKNAAKIVTEATLSESFDNFNDSPVMKMLEPHDSNILARDLGGAREFYNQVKNTLKLGEQITTKAKPKKKTPYESKRYDRAIENIKKEVTEDPDRHPAAIIFSQGFTFKDDIQDLVDYAVAKGDTEFIKIIKDAGWDEYLKESEKIKVSDFERPDEWENFKNEIKGQFKDVNNPTDEEISAVAKKFDATKEVVRQALGMKEVVPKVEVRPMEIKENPFTVQEQNTWNNYTHYPRDWNKDYAEMINNIKNNVREKLGENPPAEIENLLVEYSKRAEQYLRDKGDQMMKAPSPSVVGPANYNIRRAQKARGIYERKAKEFFDFEKNVEQKIYTSAKEVSKEKFAAMSETEKIKFNIQELKDKISKLNPQRDTFFIDKLNKQISSLENKLSKVEKPEVKKEAPVEKKPAEVAPKEEVEPATIGSSITYGPEGKVTFKEPAEEEYLDEELFITPKAEKLWSVEATSPVKIRQPRPPKAPKAAKAPKPPKDIEQNVFKILAPLIDKHTKSYLPILGGVAVKGDEVIVTNLETAVIYKLDKGIGRNILVGPEMSKASSLDEVANLQNVTNLDTQEYPLIPEVKDGPKGEITLSADQLNKALVVVGKTSRPEIDAVYFHSSKDGLNIVSTDSFRLWAQKTGIKTPEDLSFILPEGATKKLLKVIKAVNPDKVTIQLSKPGKNEMPMVQFSFGKFRIIIRVADGNYPDYGQILPKKYALASTVSRDALLKVVQKAKPFIKAAGGMESITLEIKKDSLLVQVMGKNEAGNQVALLDESIPATGKKNVSAPSGNRAIIMPIKDGAPENGIVLNRNYVEDFLKNFDGNEVTLMLENNNAPAEFVDEGGAEIASFMKGDVRFKSLDIVRRIGSDVLGFFISKPEAKFIKRFEEVLQESGLLQIVRKNLIGETFETLDEDALAIYDEQIIRIAHRMYINPASRIDSIYHELTHVLWLSLTKDQKLDLRKIFNGLKRTDPQFIKNVFSAEDEAWYRAKYSSKIKKKYPNISEEMAKELLEKKIDSEFLAHVVGKKMRFDSIIRKKLTGWLTRVLDAFLNLIRKMFRIHPTKFEIPSNELNNFIEKIFSSGGKRAPPTYLEEDIPMMMAKGGSKLDPEEEEVKLRVLKGQKIPGYLKNAVARMRKSGLLETKEDIKDKDRKLISPGVLVEVKEMAEEKGIKPGQLRTLSGKFLGMRKLESLSEAEGEQLKVLIENIVPKMVMGRPVFSIPRTTAITTQNYLMNLGGDRDIAYLEDLMEPRTVFRRAGIESDIGNPLLKAWDDVGINITKALQKVKEIKKLAEKNVDLLHMGGNLLAVLKEKARISALIFEWLDAPETVKSEIANGMSKNVLEAAKQLEVLYADYLYRINLDRVRRGKNPLRGIENYVTYLMKDLFRTYQLIPETSQQFPAGLMAAMKFQIPKEKFVKFLQKRKSKLPMKNDVWAALDAYVPAVERMLVLNPVLDRVRPSLKIVKKDTFHTGQYVDYIIKRHLLNQTHEFTTKTDRSIKKLTDKLGKKTVKLPPEIAAIFGESSVQVPRLAFPPHAIEKFIGGSKTLVYAQTIGASLPSFLLNLTQPVLAWGKLLGPMHKSLIDMLYGGVNALERVVRPSEWERLKAEGVLSDYEARITSADWSNFMGAIKNLWFMNMKVSEFINRVTVTYAKQRNVLRTGKITEAEAVKLLSMGIKEMHGAEAFMLGKDLSDLTNYKYGGVYMPKIFDHPLMKLFYIFNTFGLKTADLLFFDMLPKLKSRELFKDFSEATFGKGKDRKYQSFMEMYHDVAEGERGELLKFLLASMALAAFFSIFGYNIWKELFLGWRPNYYDWIKQMTTLVDNLKKGNLLGFNSQIKRSAEGLEALETGKLMRNGKMIQETDPWEAIKHMVFGTARTQGEKDLQDFQDELSKLEPGSSYAPGFLGRAVFQQSDYDEIRTYVVSYIEDKGYMTLSQVKGDSKLVKKISDYNKDVESRLYKIVIAYNKSGGKITKSEYNTKLKEITISPNDIVSWMQTRKKQQSIPSFERRF